MQGRNSKKLVPVRRKTISTNKKPLSITTAKKDQQENAVTPSSRVHSRQPSSVLFAEYLKESDSPSQHTIKKQGEIINLNSADASSLLLVDP